MKPVPLTESEMDDLIKLHRDNAVMFQDMSLRYSNPDLKKIHAESAANQTKRADELLKLRWELWPIICQRHCSHDWELFKSGRLFGDKWICSKCGERRWFGQLYAPAQGPQCTCEAVGVDSDNRRTGQTVESSGVA